MPFASLNGHEIHYSDSWAGKDSSESPKATIVFVHGLGSTQNYYFPILPALSSYRCITFDNYGAGRSKLVSGQAETSIPIIASDALALMDHLSIPKAVITGYSMGGMVPTHIAATSPDRIEGAVCIGPVHPTSNVAEAFQKRISAVQEGGMEAMANTIPYAAPGPQATAVDRSFIREMLLSQDVDGYVANCKAIATATPPKYEDVKCPVLIIGGGEDKSAPVEGCKKIFGELGVNEEQKNLELLPWVGHWYCVEAPDQVAYLIETFMEEIGH